MPSKPLKNVIRLINPPAGHWVGDGFPVRTLFDYNGDIARLSPFLMLDRAGPYNFAPTDKQRGVGEHPHRGFETVTIVYSGAVAHRDSGGNNAGTIMPGDVQWMTAGRGVVHEEFHAPEFAATGGTLDMVQLWVNLPARAKMMPPRYQAAVAADIPSTTLGGAAKLRVVAGALEGLTGPVDTITPMQVADMVFTTAATVQLAAEPSWHVLLVVLAGSAVVANRSVGEGQMLVLDNQHPLVSISAEVGTRLLWLSGQPLNEPVVGHGPFVMNTRDEIITAITDYQAGLFGQLQ